MSCPRSLELPTSRIRSPAQEQLFVHDEFLEIWVYRPSALPVLHGSRREFWATVVQFCFVGFFLFVVPLTFVILLDAFRILVGEFWFLIRYIFKGFSQCRVVVGYALQVSPAVTRLTVYRRLQVRCDHAAADTSDEHEPTRAWSGRCAHRTQPER